MSLISFLHVQNEHDVNNNLPKYYDLLVYDNTSNMIILRNFHRVSKMVHSLYI